MTRLQLDVARSSGIPFHTLLSSELLGLTKPDPAIYCKGINLARLLLEHCYMVASHLYDLEAAKTVGMQTIYVHRTTEDVDVNIRLDVASLAWQGTSPRTRSERMMHSLTASTTCNFIHVEHMALSPVPPNNT